MRLLIDTSIAAMRPDCRQREITYRERANPESLLLDRRTGRRSGVHHRTVACIPASDRPCRRFVCSYMGHHRPVRAVCVKRFPA